MSQAETLDRIVDPVSRCLTPEVARNLVALRADPDLQERVNWLAARSNEGELTAEERDEYELFVRAGEIVEVLQAKARKLLRQPPR